MSARATTAVGTPDRTLRRRRTGRPAAGECGDHWTRRLTRAALAPPTQLASHRTLIGPPPPTDSPRTAGATDHYPEPPWRRLLPIPRTRASRCTRSSRSVRRGPRCGRRSIDRCRGRRPRCIGPTTSMPPGQTRTASSGRRADGRSPCSCATPSRSWAPSPSPSPAGVDIGIAACSSGATSGRSPSWSTPARSPSPTAPTACRAGSASSPLARDEGSSGRWPGEVIWSGAHIESLRHLRTGRADVACIDAVSLTHIKRLYPDLVADLHEIGNGRSCRALPSSCRRRLRVRSSTILRERAHVGGVRPARGRRVQHALHRWLRVARRRGVRRALQLVTV